MRAGRPSCSSISPSHRDQARRFAIRAIPTQIFFDAEGREVYRHLGFLDENSIIRQLQKMGVAAAGGRRRNLRARHA